MALSDYESEPLEASTTLITLYTIVNTIEEGAANALDFLA